MDEEALLDQSSLPVNNKFPAYQGPLLLVPDKSKLHLSELHCLHWAYFTDQPDEGCCSGPESRYRAHVIFGCLYLNKDCTL